MALSIEDIHAAADRLMEAGQQPTLAAVRAVLGGGSFTTISEAMKTWRARQKAQEAQQVQVPQAVMERLSALAADLWRTATAAADERIAAERQALDLARAEMEQAQLGAAELADQLTAELNAARGQVEKMQAEVAALREQLTQAQLEATAKAAALEQSQARVADLLRILEHEQQARSQAEARAAEVVATVAALRAQQEGERCGSDIPASAPTIKPSTFSLTP